MLAQPLGIEFGADLLAHQTLVQRVQLDPFALHLVDELARQRGAVPQFDLQPADAAVLVRPVHEQPRGVEAAQRAGAGEREEGIVLDLVLAGLAGVMGEDDARVRTDRLAQELQAVLQEEHHGGVVVLATPLGSAVEEIADRVDDDDVGRRVGECGPDRLGHAGDALRVEQQLQLRRGDEGVARGGNHGGGQRDLLHALAQVVILDLGLKVEHAQRPGRREAKEWHASGHVDEPGEQEVALADLGRPAQHQETAWRQHARPDDVLGHGARVVEQSAEAEGRQRAGRGIDMGREQERRAIALHMQLPEAFGLGHQPIERPGRAQHGGVVAADRLPARERVEAALVHQAHVMADGGAGPLEPRPVVDRAFAHRRGEHRVDAGLRGRRGNVAGEAYAWQRWHLGDLFGEIRKIHLDRAMFADLHEALVAVLVIDGAGHPDRLVRRAEMRVAADLHGDLAAQAAEGGQVVALGGFGQLPPDMELRRALGRAPAAFDDERRCAEVAGDMVQLGRDVACVEIDDDGLHLQHVGGACLTLLLDRAGDDIDRRPLAVRPRGESRELAGCGAVGRDPDVVRLAVPALTLVNEAAERDQPLAPAEHGVEEHGDLLGVGVAAEGVL
ncbi:hypothetical protein A6302_04273 [Methylobrevis pamukkalensis]|uniref:Uncharacterized protein n=1 Tax=Methylobrevis pamukkalensis TaxID=1439726 RepID=A0A1E3GWJ6_9HYPH|nr:hypothetical protein A6302_04273 [Methylobrevis pamukkalensis]